MSRNVSATRESTLTFRRWRPAAARAGRWRSRRKPLVVRDRSVRPSGSMAARRATISGSSRRTSGSPPVRRTLVMPMPTSRPTSRSISSGVSSSPWGRNVMSSEGMQYRQRNWQASVTETRRARSVRPNPSTSGPSPCRCAGPAPFARDVPRQLGDLGQHLRHRYSIPEVVARCTTRPLLFGSRPTPRCLACIRGIAVTSSTVLATTNRGDAEAWWPQYTRAAIKGGSRSATRR